MESVVVVRLRELFPDYMGVMKEANIENRAFSSMEKAEEWLYRNGFRIGQRCFFNYTPKDGKEWIREDDVAWNYVTVVFEEYKLDSGKESVFKDHFPRMSPETYGRHFSEECFQNKITEFKSMAECDRHSVSSSAGDKEEKNK